MFSSRRASGSSGSLHRIVVGAFLLPLAGALALCAGCAGSEVSGSEPTTVASSPAVTAAPNGGPTAVPTSSGSSSTTSSGSTKASASGSSAAPTAPAPTAARSVKAFARPGASAKRIAVTAGSFGQPLRWADGVTVEVTKTASGTTQGDGPGQTAGQAITRFDLTITNDSDTAVDATSVVITTTYGSKTVRLAGAVYDETAADFGSVIALGQSAQAVYVYTIPVASRGAVSLTVDLDGAHQPAVIKGSVA